MNLIYSQNLRVGGLKPISRTGPSDTNHPQVYSMSNTDSSHRRAWIWNKYSSASQQIFSLHLFSASKRFKWDRWIFQIYRTTEQNTKNIKDDLQVSWDQLFFVGKQHFVLLRTHITTDLLLRNLYKPSSAAAQAWKVMPIHTHDFTKSNFVYQKTFPVIHRQNLLCTVRVLLKVQSKTTQHKILTQITANKAVQRHPVCQERDLAMWGKSIVKKGLRPRQAIMAHSRWGSKFSTLPSNRFRTSGISLCPISVPGLASLRRGEVWRAWGSIRTRPLSLAPFRFGSSVDVPTVLMFYSAGCSHEVQRQKKW